MLTFNIMLFLRFIILYLEMLFKVFIVFSFTFLIYKFINISFDFISSYFFPTVSCYNDVYNLNYPNIDSTNEKMGDIEMEYNKLSIDLENNDEYIIACLFMVASIIAVIIFESQK